MTWLLLLLTLLLDADGADDEADEAEEDEPTRDPEARIKSLMEANERLAKKVEQRDARIVELEAADASASADGEALNTLRLEVAFLRECITTDQPISDLDTAWTLGHARGFFDAVEIDDAGEVSGMSEALTRIASRYPWLSDAPADGPEPEPRVSGRKIGSRKKRDGGAELRSDRAALEKRMPALRRRAG